LLVGSRAVISYGLRARRINGGSSLLRSLSYSKPIITSISLDRGSGFKEVYIV
jgi:hypothetical protein